MSNNVTDNKVSSDIIKSFQSCARVANDFNKTYSQLQSAFVSLNSKLTNSNDVGLIAKDFLSDLSVKLEEINEIINNMPKVSNQVIKINEIIEFNGEALQKTTDELEKYKEDINKITKITEQISDFKDIIEVFSEENFTKYHSELNKEFTDINDFYKVSMSEFKNQITDYKKAIKELTKTVRDGSNITKNHVEKNASNNQKIIEKTRQELLTEKKQYESLKTDLLKKINFKIKGLKDENANNFDSILKKLNEVDKHKPDYKELVDKIVLNNGKNVTKVKNDMTSIIKENNTKLNKSLVELSKEIKKIQDSNNKNFDELNKRIEDLEIDNSKLLNMKDTMYLDISKISESVVVEAFNKFKAEFNEEFFLQLHEFFEDKFGVANPSDKVELFTLKTLRDKNKKFPFYVIDHLNPDKSEYFIRKFDDEDYAIYSLVINGEKIKTDDKLEIYEQRYELIGK